MPGLLILLAIIAPSAADIQALEVTRVIGPYVETTRDGRFHAEFAPSVETRGTVCEATGDDAYDCRYETRTKAFFDNEFGAWEAIVVQLQWKEGRWRIIEPGK
ncbi:hypothetical protein [Sphingopyxis sp.]|uniref:hypothetical protein n=1 Tax=Sphingopyxis sp. TaxID=1908224 RepID=UPI003D128767